MFFHLKKKLDWSGRMLLIILVVALLARIVYALRPAIPWWDETIYIGMAKWIFSGGTLGYWETFRPLVMPFLLGLGWKAGFGIIFWGKFLEIIASMGIMVLTYFIGEKMYKHAGIIAVSMMAFLPVFFSYGNKLLTGIPATFFALLALYFLYEKKWYWLGFFAGLAFLTRFILALFAIGIAFGIVVSWLANKKDAFKKKTLDDLFRKVAKMLVGFFTLVIPYLVSNLFLYGDAFFPIKEGSRVFTQYNNWLYEGGTFFYLIEAVLKQNPFLIFFVLGIVAFIRLKMWKSELQTTIVSAMILPMLYFMIIAHKEVRFYIPILPLIAICAGLGIAWMLFMSQKKWKKKFSVKNSRIIITIIIIVSLIANASAISRSVPEASLSGDKETYYHYFDNASQNDSLFIASGPLYMVYTDKPITFLRSWELAEEVWSRYGDTSSHVAIDLCDHPCEQGSECETWRADFLQKMKSRGSKVFDGVYEQWDGQSCEVFIWETS